MARQFNVNELGTGFCIKNGERADAIADIDALGVIVVAHVVSVLSTLHRPDAFEGMAVENPASPIGGIRDKNAVEFGNVGDALRFSEARKTLDELAGFQ